MLPGAELTGWAQCFPAWLRRAPCAKAASHAPAQSGGTGLILLRSAPPRKVPAPGWRSFKNAQPPPISAPAAKTSAPPSTTWKVARKNGVFINRFWIQTMAQSSTNTTTIARMVAVQNEGIR